ncbi:MAG: hypothetical protein JKY52_12590 [Flavobacteriales bacterium]|nr:hypothetical protein [Flavobacteriales bacterium]
MHSLKTTIQNTLLLLAVIVALSTNQAFAQDALDISDKNLNKKQNLEDFYRSELRKGTLLDTRRADYTEKLTELQTEIKAIREERMQNAINQKESNPSILENEELSAQFRELDIAINDSAPPALLANEPKSLVFNVGVSFLSVSKYSAPVILSAEKVLSEKLSVGGYLGHFLEKVIDDSLRLDSNAYFNSNKANYKHTYVNFGVKASYHFFEPTFILSPTKFDPYVSVMLGYTLTTGTHPFLSNEQFLNTDSEGNTVAPGEGESAFIEPTKKGINFGVFGGLRYMYDDHLGFFAELGYANTAFATIGASYRILDKGTQAGAAAQVVHFKVKIIESPRQKRKNSKAFKGVEAEEIQTKKGFIYVLTGESTSFEDATTYQLELSSGLFKRAEVVAVKDGAVIKMAKAKKLMGIVDEEPEEDKKKGKDEDDNEDE